MSQKQKLEALLDGIIKNRAALESCPMHHFGDFKKLHPDAKFGKMSKIKLKCTECGGLMRLADIENYGHGYRAALRDPNEILSNYFDQPATDQSKPT